MNERIKPTHLERKAVVYVRQSTAYQVANNLESQRLQYAMAGALERHGWHDVEVIDSDLGKSAGGSVERAGFERLLAKVCLGEVGAVAARELSRFARNSREWQHLVEVCRIVDTLLIDEEAVYDSRRTNNRLLLGLKGSLNEYELDVLRQRSQAAREQKAGRAELGMNCPVGYVNAGGGVLEKHPDKRVQQAVAVVFEKFLELASARQVMMWFDSRDFLFPRPLWNGSEWTTVWKGVTYHAVLRTLKNPIYAGAYAWGRTATAVTLKAGRVQRTHRRKPIQEWSVLEKDHHDSYVAWATYERIQEMLHKNAQAYTPAVPGAAKRGSSLLAGLVRCRRCGNKLHVRYGNGAGSIVLRYSCHVAYHTTGATKCISFGGDPVDEAVVACVLEVIQPGLEDAVGLVLSDQETGEQAALETLRLELQAGEYEVERARRQYDAVDPSNRLVAGELERRWNATMDRLSQVRQRLESEQRIAATASRPSRAVVTALIDRFPTVWESPATDARLKKRIVRALIEEIVVDVDEDSSEVVVLVHWKGGVHTELRVPRRRAGRGGRCVPLDTVEAVRSLSRICPDTSIAGWLTRSGSRTPGGNCWTRQDVTGLRHRHGIDVYEPERQQREGWLNLTQAAEYLSTDRTTLRRRIESGHLPAERPLCLGPWILKRSQLAECRSQVAPHGDNNPTGSTCENVTLELFSASSKGAV